MLFEKTIKKAKAAPTEAYEALVSFWHKGVLIAEGEVVHMTANAAKYLSHAIVSVKDKAKAEVEAIETAVVAEVVSVEDKVKARFGKGADKISEPAAADAKSDGVV